MKAIAIIPARSGSKGLPDKNIKPLNGKPLIAYSIEQAIASQKFDKVFVSTDSENYAQIAREYGADVSFLRSSDLASDNANTWDAVREVLVKFDELGEEFDTVMLLQPTSPLRDSEDILNAFKLMEEKSANAIESVVEVDHSPLWCNVLPADGCMDSFENPELSILPRQSLPQYYRINGAIYLLKRSELNEECMFTHNCFAYIMPKEKSVDIDGPIDFMLAELIMNKREGE